MRADARHFTVPSLTATDHAQKQQSAALVDSGPID